MPNSWLVERGEVRPATWLGRALKRSGSSSLGTTMSREVEPRDRPVTAPTAIGMAVPADGTPYNRDDRADERPMAGGLQAADGALAVGDATSNSEPTAAFLVRQGGLVRRVGPGSRVGSGPTSEPNDQTAPDRSLPELGTTCWQSACDNA